MNDLAGTSHNSATFACFTFTWDQKAGVDDKGVVFLLFIAILRVCGARVRVPGLDELGSVC